MAGPGDTEVAWRLSSLNSVAATAVAASSMCLARSSASAEPWPPQ
jgi:hypothetical protein